MRIEFLGNELFSHYRASMRLSWKGCQRGQPLCASDW